MIWVESYHWEKTKLNREKTEKENVCGAPDLSGGQIRFK